MTDDMGKRDTLTFNIFVNSKTSTNKSAPVAARIGLARQNRCLPIALYVKILLRKISWNYKKENANWQSPYQKSLKTKYSVLLLVLRTVFLILPQSRHFLLSNQKPLLLLQLWKGLLFWIAPSAIHVPDLK